LEAFSLLILLPKLALLELIIPIDSEVTTSTVPKLKLALGGATSLEVEEDMDADLSAACKTLEVLRRRRMPVEVLADTKASGECIASSRSWLFRFSYEYKESGGVLDNRGFSIGVVLFLLFLLLLPLPLLGDS
jgi:hypothetical protein